jgi:hypothetical protein
VSATRLGERRISKFVEDFDLEPGHLIGELRLTSDAQIWRVRNKPTMASKLNKESVAILRSRVPLSERGSRFPDASIKAGQIDMHRRPPTHTLQDVETLTTGSGNHSSATHRCRPK